MNPTNIMTNIALIIICLLSSAAIADSTSIENTDLVIVTSNNSTFTTIKSKDIRRLYLGLKNRKNSSPILPVRNYSDEKLHEVFLQKVMFMSSRTYERQLNLRTIRKGLKPPLQLSSNQTLIQALIANKNTITYMWVNQVHDLSDIRIVKVY